MFVGFFFMFNDYRTVKRVFMPIIYNYKTIYLLFSL